MNRDNVLLPSRNIPWRPALLAGLLPAVAAAVLLFSWRWNGQQARRADDWRQRTQQCLILADQIRVLRHRPRRFEDHVLESHAVAAYVEQASARAGMTLQQIASIRPEPPQRVGGSDYVQSMVKLRLNDLTAEQLARLIFDLQQRVPGMAVPQLRLWAPSADAETWEAEISLLGLSYIPRQRQEGL